MRGKVERKSYRATPARATEGGRGTPQDGRVAADPRRTLRQALNHLRLVPQAIHL